MSDHPTLVFLHGVGDGNPQGNWKRILNESLTRLGYPTIDEVEVIAPIYAHALKGTDDEGPVPPLTIPDLSRDKAAQHRWAVETRTSALERMLNAVNNPGQGVPGGNQVVEAALYAPIFSQARNYLRDPNIRAGVLQRILKAMPKQGEILLVGHSLGSVIAADLVRRLPPEVTVTGLVTIGSPLANGEFDVDNLRRYLEAPPSNLRWWVNIWDSRDPVSAHRGVSSLFPWMLDRRVNTDPLKLPHYLPRFLETDEVALPIGHALFGSLSKDLVLASRDLEIAPTYVETLTLLALRYGHLVASNLDPKLQTRYRSALAETQTTVIAQLTEQARLEGRPQASAITELVNHPKDEDGWASSPSHIRHLSKMNAANPLVSVALANVIAPFQISVPKSVQRDAFEELTIEMGLGRQLGLDLVDSRLEAEKALEDGARIVFKWAALGVGVLAILTTGGMAIAAAPAGLAGAAAITAGLAAFGPGGMVGGLLTAGALVGVSSGGIASSLASTRASVHDVETLLVSRLTAAILRQKQKLEQDPDTWLILVDSEREIRRSLQRLSTFSDRNAAVVKDAKKKLAYVEKAVEYLAKHGLGPAPLQIEDADADAG